MNKNILILFLCFVTALIAFLFGCTKADEPIIDDPNDYVTVIDTINVTKLNLSYDLRLCISDNVVKFNQDSFLVTDKIAYKNLLTSIICDEHKPNINFNDSMILGYKTEIGTGKKSDLMLVCRTKNRIKNCTYSITDYTNDTLIRDIERNWIRTPRLEIDTLDFNLQILEE